MALPSSWVFADTGEGGGVILDVSSGVLGATVMDDIIYSWYSTDTNPDNVVVISWLQMTNLTGPYDLTVNLSYVSDGAVDGGVTFSNLQYGQTVSVPIPGTVWLLGSGLVGLVAAHRKKRN